MNIQNQRPRLLLCMTVATLLGVTACQNPPPIPTNPAPLASEYNRALLVPPAPVIPDDSYTSQLKTIDKADIDARLNLLSKYARHYPPHFDDKRSRRAAEADIKDILPIVNSAAAQSGATHAQLLQAFKANCMARNLDVGDNTTTHANDDIRQALRLKPSDPETNFWYGVLLSEGGGMTEGMGYLNKAAKGGYAEAYLSLANAYLSLNKKPKALASITSYQKLVPDDNRVPDMINAVKADKASIW